MMTALDAVASVLVEAERAHAAAFASVDGVDPEWPVFYADWLIDSSPLPALLARTPGRDELRDVLAETDGRYAAERPDEDWSRFCAGILIERYGAAGDAAS